LEALRQNTEGALIDRVGINPPPMMHSGIIQAREFEDPPGLHEKTEYLLREWVGLYHSPAAGLDSSKAFSQFVAQVGFIFLHVLIKCFENCWKFQVHR
jgi:CCR4-NOT transcription complex subunit 1